MFESVAARSSSVTLPRSTPFERFDSIARRPFAMSSSLMSRRMTLKPADAATCAMPWPIVPAPMTATVRIRKRSARSGIAPAACAEVLSSRGVLKWPSSSVEVGEVPALRAVKIRLRLREKLYYTREEKGYRKTGAKTVEQSASVSCNPAYRQIPEGELKPEA